MPALILSDQCTHTIKVAVFNNGENTEFRDSREFGGSVFKQLDDTFAYLNLCNKTTATIKQLERVESVDYPEEALREALLNAIVHRDYGFSGSIIINVNDDKMEFISAETLLFLFGSIILKVFCVTSIVGCKLQSLYKSKILLIPVP